MPDRMSTATPGRGAAAEDIDLFTPAAMPRLHAAAEEIAWLLGRGYPTPTVIRTVGDHHQLHARQRLALQRSICSAAQRADRHARVVSEEALCGRDLAVDAFNLIVTLEVALSGGVLLAGTDGALRDLAGLRGNYRLIDETEAALVLLGDAVTALGVASLSFLVDAPVSNSGRLRGRILDHAARWPAAVTATLVPDADPALAGKERVVSSDSMVIDTSVSWVSLAAWIVRTRIPNAWLVDLTPSSSIP
ncbi:Hypothetical protein A7982_10304 [Minicystis rosea]|nr:Hypothetical protein A7982_10304 [Minicystis rosea]